MQAEWLSTRAEESGSCISKVEAMFTQLDKIGIKGTRRADGGEMKEKDAYVNLASSALERVVVVDTQSEVNDLRRISTKNAVSD